MSKLLRHSAVYVVLGFLPVAINFLLAPLYTSALDPKEYAIIGLGTLFQTFLVFFLSFSLDGALTRLYFNYSEHSERTGLLSTLLISCTIISVVILSLFAVFGDALLNRIFTSGSFTFSELGIWVFASTYSTVIYLLFLGYLRNAERIRSYSFWSILFFILPVLGILLGLFVFKAGSKGAIIGRAAGSLFVVALMLISFYRREPLVFRRNLLRVSMKYSLPLIPYQLMFAAFSNIDRIVLERYFTLHDFGVYNFAAMVSGLIPIFMNSISNALNPRIYKELADDPDSLQVARLNQLNLIGTTLVICGCMALVVPAMRIFINQSYADSYVYAGFLFLAYLPYSHYLIYTLPLFFFGKTAVFPVISFLALASGVFFNLAFLSSLGIWSVCLSLMVVRTIQLASASFFNRRYSYHRQKYVKQKGNIWASVALVSTYLALLLINSWYHYLPVDVINCVPLVLFCIICTFSHRSELQVLFQQVRHVMNFSRIRKKPV